MAIQKQEGIAKRYFGGKGASGTIQKIINCIRPHDTLIIPCLGNDTLSRIIKRPARVIGNDIDGDVFRKWQELNYDWIELHNMDAVNFLKSIDFSKLGKVVIYIDPPYPLNSRKSQAKVYNHEMTDEQHIQLLKAVMKLPNNVDVLISTYPNELYEQMLKGWFKIKFQSKTSHGMATEVLYRNYEDINLLHDYRFTGTDYRERDRIKKKTRRWLNNILKMPEHERKAIFLAIANLSEFEDAVKYASGS
jgi:DNA adenine methylase